MPNKDTKALNNRDRRFSSSSKWGWLLVCCIICIPMIALLYNHWIGPLSLLITDDSYFYSQIAYKISTIHRSTFDGITDTSGYHLLWMGMISTLSFVVESLGLAKDAHLIAHVSFSLLLVISSTMFFLRGIVPRLAFILYALFGYLGLEVNLLIFLVLMLYTTLVSRVEGGKLCLLPLISMILIPLTRIDAVVILIPLLVILLIGREGRLVLHLTAALLIGCLAHFAILYILHGEFLTTSSFLKAAVRMNSDIPLLRQAISNLSGVAIGREGSAVMARFWTIALLASISLSFALYIPYTQKSRTAIGIIVGAILFILMHLVTGAAKSWYFVIPMCLLLYTATDLRERARPDGRASWKYIGLSSALSVLLVVTSLSIIASKTDRELKVQPVRVAALEFIRSLDKVLPPNTRIFQVDLTGAVAFHSNQIIINGDGLVNSMEYVRHLVTDEIDRNYLDEMGICHLIGTRGVRNGLIRFENDVISLTDALAFKEDDLIVLDKIRTFGNKSKYDYVLYERRDGVCSKK